MSDTCPVCQNEIKPNATACDVCGFKIVGNTKAFQPVKIDVPVLKEAANAERGILREVRGPQVGITFPISGDEITIGRNQNSTIFLNDMTVSRQHATIRNVDGNYVIYDERSYNGVWVNNKNVQAKTLHYGDKIQIGTFGFIYEPDSTN